MNGGSFVNKKLASAARHRLYRNNRNGRFTGCDRHSGDQNLRLRNGRCSADYDNDGSADLFITSFGGNQLYRNNGSGRFDDVTAKAGAGSRLWSASCAFGDIDNEGDVDLYVTNYVDFTPDNNKFRDLKAGSSYLAQNDMRVHFGLGQAARVDRLEIRWPSGVVDSLENIEANQIVTVLEGKGITGRKPFEK